jgi:hypothetical protein
MIGRLIYQNDRQVGADPEGSYVYLWRHGATDRYVGKGVNGRWAYHLTEGVNADTNRPKARYFAEHGAAMECRIVAEGLTETEAAKVELAEINARGLLADGTGTLLNSYRGSVVYGPRRPKGERLADPRSTWERMKARIAQGINMNARIRRLAPTIGRNPKSPNCAGYAFIELYPPAGETISIADMLEIGRKHGFKDRSSLMHTAWDIEKGYIAIEEPCTSS